MKANLTPTPTPLAQIADAQQQLAWLKHNKYKKLNVKNQFKVAFYGDLAQNDSVSDRLFENDEFRRHAAANQWSDRQERGIGRFTNIFEFLQQVYGEWMSKGLMTKQDLWRVDKDAYRRLTNTITQHGQEVIPPWFNLPTSYDKKLADAPKEDRALIEANREYEKRRWRKRSEAKLELKM
jgi:hypothetical protein